MTRCQELDHLRLEMLTATGGLETSRIDPDDIYVYLVRKSQSTLFEVYRHSRKPIEAEMISATALFYFKFYISESVIKYDPRVVFVACMNLAAKTEEYHGVSLSDLVNALPDAASLKSSVPLIEMKVLKSLDFDLVVEQPWQIMLYWVESIRSPGDQPQTYLKLYDSACDIIRTWQWTDAVIVFNFPKLATAAVYKACILLDSSGSVIDASSPDDLSLGRWTGRFITFSKQLLPSLRVEEVLIEIENVVNRFGHFDKVVKDPSFELTDGYKSLLAIIANMSTR